MASWELQVTNLLTDILLELKAMRKQEKDYWETWKKAKQNES